MDPLARRNLGRTAVELTQLGFGGAGLGDLFDIVDDRDADATLRAAWDAGIRYFDTSPWYAAAKANTVLAARCIAGRGQTMCCPPKSAGCSVLCTTLNISSTASGAVG
jgi:aryl-alcohol dehydrogenase-like predicted oxidoreductase